MNLFAVLSLNGCYVQSKMISLYTFEVVYIIVVLNLALKERLLTSYSSDSGNYKYSLFICLTSIVEFWLFNMNLI